MTTHAHDLTREAVEQLLAGWSGSPWTLEERGNYEPRPDWTDMRNMLGLLGHAEAHVLDQDGEGTVGEFVTVEDARLARAAPDLAMALIAAWDEIDRLTAALANQNRETP